MAAQQEAQLDTISKAMMRMGRLRVAAPISEAVTAVNALPRQRSMQRYRAGWVKG